MEIMTDYLVIGSGIAGLSFALHAAESGTVAIVTKKERMETATNYAQGGIASVLDNDDNFDLHIKDTLKSGDGLCNKKIVDIVVKNGPDRIKELIDIGVKFSHKPEDPDNLDLVTDPVRREVNPATVTTQTHFLFQHLFAVNFELHFSLSHHLRDLSASLLHFFYHLRSLFFCPDFPLPITAATRSNERMYKKGLVLSCA